MSLADTLRVTYAPNDLLIALLKLSEETDLDILNSCMETMVDRYQAELLPVAAELTARLVSIFRRSLLSP